MILTAARTRLLLFTVTAALHAVFLLFFIVKLEAAKINREPPPTVMKILDLAEEEPLVLPAAVMPPPPEQAADVPDNAVESIAETLVETEEEPDQTVLAPGSLGQFSSGVPGAGTGTGYLSMSQISVAPVFNERDILGRLVYPPIARRAGIEGLVYLELLIDREGTVRQTRILREDPAGRGFGEAAVRAFEGARCRPAESNGTAVGVRYRYPVRFRLAG